MFSRFRGRLTWVNVAMTLALVFAMSGGAYAAKRYLITSTKQISPSVLKQLQGKAGAQGSAGAPGPVGEKGAAGSRGETGLEGKAGASGTSGKSVASSAASSGECPEGGTKFEVEGAGKSSHVCNGEKGAKGAAGSPWTPNGTLPSEATETGTWAFGPEAVKPPFRYLAIASFPIPLAKPLIDVEECGETGHPSCVTHVSGEPSFATNCPGTVKEPKAKPGNFCVYVEKIERAKIGSIATGENFEFGVGTAGAFAEISEYSAAEAEGVGTWAVTAE